ncbi:twin-arginine translocase TatA/TatE family subunit [bacterium]|nr:twin-arginine translocase TatA/TatE family subunit [bacterium]MBU1983400.1 twin-arginine translocase TatA/TatE family subunit [bacterium]
MNIGASELLIVALVILLLFGGQRLPDAARAFGRSLAMFRQAMYEVRAGVENAGGDKPPIHPSSTSSTESERTSVTVQPHDAAQPRVSPEPPQSDS